MARAVIVHAMVLKVWRDAAAARALEDSDDLRRTVQAIQRAGFLLPPQRVRLFELDEI